MNTRFVEMKKSMQARWKPEWSKELSLMPVAKAFNTSLSAVEALMSKSADMRATGKFSQQGLTDEIRGAAQAATVPVLRRASEAVERARNDLKQRRAALAVPKPDPTNVAEAIMRGEMRTWLRGLPQTQAVQALLNDAVDDRMLQAAFEAPAIMSGLTDQDRDMVQTRLVERRFGPELERVNELEEAVTVANSAVEIALYQLRQEAQFGAGDDRAFDAWMGKATEAAEVADRSKPVEEEVSEMHAHLDEVFAVAFPTLYPDHPVNRAP